LSVFCLLALMLTTSNRSVEAAPELVLRDRLDIQLDPIRRSGSSVEVRGRLVQLGDGEGAPYLSIRLQYDERWVTLLTDGNGYFYQRFAGSEGEHMLSVDVTESRFFDAAHLEMADFDIEKRPLELILDAPSTLPDTATELEIKINATSDGRPVDSLQLEVLLASIGDELTTAAQTETNRGQAVVVISQEQLGEAGRKRIEVRFAGDQNHDAATVSSIFQVTSSSSLSLASNGSDFSFGDAVKISGRLEDGRGNPIVNAVISLEVQSQRIESTKTDERGDYHLSIDSEELGSGSAIALQAIYRPTESWKAQTKSTPISISIGDRKPISMSLALAAFAITGLGLLSFVGLRARPWERWRRSAKDDDIDQSDDDEIVDVVPKTGFVAGRAKLSNTFRKAHYQDIQGTVRCVMTHKAINMARIEVTGTPAQVLQTNAKGDFRTAVLHAGEHTVRVMADGYVSEEFPVLVPHRGEFHNTTVDLLPVREKIFALYKDALRPRLPNPKLWGIWTPRQILDHVRSSKPNAALAELTDFVEESFFSQRSPHEDVLESARTLVRAFHQQ